MKTKTAGANDMLTDCFSEPLNGATTAIVDINSGAGNLTVERITGDEELLAGGTLQYFEKQSPPTHTLNSNNGQATLTLRGKSNGHPWFRLPWAACNGATEWQIQLNPAVSFDITAHIGGGNIQLNLAGMAVTRLSADTGGGNVDVILPDNVAGLSVNVGTGAGNVEVHVPGSVAARIHATSGLGKLIVDSRFTQIDAKTFQSPDYDSATNRVEINASTGAGNVIVSS